MTGSIDDSLAETITELTGDPGAARYVGAVSATLAVGNAVRGVMAGIEIASRVRLAFAAACPDATLIRHLAGALMPTGP